MLQVCLFVGTK